MSDLIDDLFDDETSIRERERAKSEDSDFDAVFQSLSKTNQASPKGNKRQNSLDDVDAFLQKLDFDTPTIDKPNLQNKVKNEDEKDLLKWLDEDSNSNKDTVLDKIKNDKTNNKEDTLKKTADASKDIKKKKSSILSFGSLSLNSMSYESDDEEDLFNINESGQLQVSIKESNIEGEDEQDGVVEKKEKDIVLNKPTLKIAEGYEKKNYFTISEKLCDLDDTKLQAKIENRIETLFEIDQFDVAALRSAVSMKGFSGRLLPSNIRKDIWGAIILNSKLSNAPTPGWFLLQDTRLSEIFPSVRKCIRKDCSQVWSLLSNEELIDEDLIDNISGFVCRLVFRQNCKVYHILLTNIALTCIWLCCCSSSSSSSNNKFDETLMKEAAKLVDAISNLWGGKDGNWSNTGLIKEISTGNSDIYNSVGGAGWTSNTLPLVMFRRQEILRKLVLYYDPILGVALDNNIEGWDPLTISSTNDSKSKENEGDYDVLVTRSIRLNILDTCKNYVAKQKLPCQNLFGLLSPMNLPKKSKSNPNSGLLILWDSCLFLEADPQLMSFYFAAASLMLNRDILLEKTSEMQDIVDSMIETIFSVNGKVQELVTMAELMFEMAPLDIKKWIGELELLMRIPSNEEYEKYIAKLVQSKISEQSLIEKKKKEEEEKASQEITSANIHNNTTTDTTTCEDIRAEDNIVKGTEKNENIEKLEETNTATTMSAKAGWMATALKRRAQNLKTAWAKSMEKSNIDYSKFNLNRRLVEFNGDQDEVLGMGFMKGKYGLEVASVEKKSVAARTNLVYPGDLIMTVNGLLVLGLSAQEAEALIHLQERPLYMVLASIQEKKTEEEEEDLSLTAQKENLLLISPNLEERVENYYSKYNPDKVVEVDKILSIYSHHESVLFEELAFKYLDHIEGDPFYSTLSAFCLPMSPEEVINNSNMHKNHEEKSNKNIQTTKKNEKSKKLFVVDVRSSRIIKQTGRLPTGYVLDPSNLSSPEMIEEMKKVFLPMQGDMQICIMGSGGDKLLQEFNPKQARLIREKDRRVVDTCASFLLSLGFPLVSVVEGGFLGCYILLKENKYNLDDYLINLPPIKDRSLLNKFDAFCKYRMSSPSSIAQFLASKARANREKHREVRTETALSFSGLSDESKTSATIAANAAATKVSTMFGSYWKSPVASNSNNLSTNGNDATQNHTKEEKTGNISDSNTTSTSTTTQKSSFFSNLLTRTSSKEENIASNSEVNHISESVEMNSAANENLIKATEDGQNKTSSTSSWKYGGWSKSFKSMKVPDATGLSTKFKTSMNQAYASASQKLNTVATEFNTPYDEIKKSEQAREDPMILEKIKGIKKGDAVNLNDLGKLSLYFESEKLKVIEGNKKLCKRLLIITSERFLVGEPIVNEKNKAMIKSNHELGSVVRMRYPNNNPSSISLFYKKEGFDEPRATTYSFATNAKAFTKALMQACANYNSNKEAKKKEKEKESKAEILSNTEKAQIDDKIVVEAPLDENEIEI